jgi:peptidoglycan/LPS O-acetylase OafA/YrhL
MLGTLLGLLSGRARRIIGVILLVVAVLMVVGAVLGTIASINLRANGVRTNATIVNVSTNFSRHTATSYTDVIRFSTADGKQYQESISGSRGERVGGTVAVIYDPSDPGTVQEASDLSGLWWLTPVVLVIFALALGWLGRRLWRSRSAAAQEAMVSEF